MKIEIKVPALGESISQATISQIIKPSGSSVAAEEEIIELETDKVNQVLYAPASGLLHWDVAVGQTVAVGSLLGSIEEQAVKKEGKPTAIPEVSKSAEEVVSEPSRPQAEPDSALYTRRKMSSLRKTIAQRLVEVKNTTAMLTTFNEIDMSTILALRTKEQENFTKRYGVKLGFMSFFVKAAAIALKASPPVNSFIEGDEIVTWNTYDIGIAVATDRGLLVPVLRGCDELSFGAIEQAIAAFADKARKGTISLDDLRGGSFTITNGGVFGSLLSTPILNPPQSAILGMHTIVKRPVAIEDRVEIRPMMYLALSYDHRIIDGREAVLFLVHLKQLLEDPSHLFLDH